MESRKRGSIFTVRRKMTMVHQYKLNGYNIVLEQKENTGKIGIQLRSFPTLTNEFILELSCSIFSSTLSKISEICNGRGFKPKQIESDRKKRIKQTFFFIFILNKILSCSSHVSKTSCSNVFSTDFFIIAIKI